MIIWVMGEQSLGSDRSAKDENAKRQNRDSIAGGLEALASST